NSNANIIHINRIEIGQDRTSGAEAAKSRIAFARLTQDATRRQLDTTLGTSSSEFVFHVGFVPTSVDCEAWDTAIGEDKSLVLSALVLVLVQMQVAIRVLVVIVRASVAGATQKKKIQELGLFVPSHLRKDTLNLSIYRGRNFMNTSSSEHESYSDDDNDDDDDDDGDEEATLNRERQKKTNKGQYFANSNGNSNGNNTSMWRSLSCDRGGTGINAILASNKSNGNANSSNSSISSNSSSGNGSDSGGSGGECVEKQQSKQRYHCITSRGQSQRSIVFHNHAPVFHNLKIHALKNTVQRVSEKWKNTNKTFHQNIIFTLHCHYCKKTQRRNRVIYPKITRKHVRECAKMFDSNLIDDALLYRCICGCNRQKELMDFDTYCMHWLEHATYYKTCVRHKKNKIEDIHMFKQCLLFLFCFFKKDYFFFFFFYYFFFSSTLVKDNYFSLLWGFAFSNFFFCVSFVFLLKFSVFVFFFLMTHVKRLIVLFSSESYFILLAFENRTFFLILQ
ncbi:hypothetical protein RFI_20376, partial [Reticulomyxa filosa]